MHRDIVNKADAFWAFSAQPQKTGSGKHAGNVGERCLRHAPCLVPFLLFASASVPAKRPTPPQGSLQLWLVEPTSSSVSKSKVAPPTTPRGAASTASKIVNSRERSRFGTNTVGDARLWRPLQVAAPAGAM